MKKAKRILALLAVFVLCLSFSGCKALDEMRASQGFWQPDGSIRVGEYTYKPVPACEELQPYFSYGYDAPMVYVTDPDVPVLLSRIMGESLDISDDDLFLEGGNAWDYEGDTYPLYCREDKYEEVVSRIEAGFTPEIYFYYYSVYNEEEYEFEEKCYDLTAEQAEAVEYVYGNVIPKTLDEGFYFESDDYLTLYVASADRLFMQEALYLEVAGQAYYLTEPQEDGTSLLYAVPTDLRATFDAIYSTYRQAEESLYEEEYDEIYL